MNRRAFLKRVAIGTGAAVGLGGTGYAYGRFEATWLHVVEATIAVPRLPSSFAGMRVALFTDPHHGRFNSLEYISTVVDTVAALSPDLVALGGDFAHGVRGRKYLAPCFAELGRLSAPLEFTAFRATTTTTPASTPHAGSLREAGITDLTNRGVWISAAGTGCDWAASTT